MRNIGGEYVREPQRLARQPRDQIDVLEQAAYREEVVTHSLLRLLADRTSPRGLVQQRPYGVAVVAQLGRLGQPASLGATTTRRERFRLRSLCRRNVAQPFYMKIN